MMLKRFIAAISSGVFLLHAGAATAQTIPTPTPAPLQGERSGGGAQASDGPLLPAPSGEAPAVASAAAAGEPAGEPTRGDVAYGAFQRGFYLTAKNLAEPLANLGDPAAQTLLGEIHSRGLGVPVDMAEAARWYQAAAEAGNAEGQFRFGLMLLEGQVVDQDVAKARDLMKAAADHGLPLAQFNYGQMLIQASPAGGFAEARTYFERAAEAGVADAQYAMAQLHEYGRGVGGSDTQAARRWLKAAAINGHDTAQIEYGIWLINGKGGKAEPADGFLFLKRAAERGNPIAINRIAHLYKDGIGTKPDAGEAAKWSVLARRAENTDPELDDFFRGLDDAAKKTALEAANRLGSS